MSSSSTPTPTPYPPVPDIDVHLQPGWLNEKMSDQELRAHQMRLLRRRWLKDQELSPREPVLPPPKHGPVGRFWGRFLETDTFWRRQVYNVYRSTLFYASLIPVMWVCHYFVKYHALDNQNGITTSNEIFFPGDIVSETNEVIPPLNIPRKHH